MRGLGLVVFSISVVGGVSMAALAGTGTDDFQKLAPPAYTAAPPTTPSPQTADNKPLPATQERVCRKQPAPTGSRLGAQQICYTKAQWNEMQQTAKQGIEDIQTRAGQFSPAGH